MITPSPSTPHCASGQSHQPGCMVQCAMPPQTSYISKALGPYPAGSMTTSSFEFNVFFSRTTTRGAGHGIRTSSPGVNIKKAGGSGLEVGYLRMVCSRSLTKTTPFHARIYLGHQCGRWRMCYMGTTWDIDVLSQKLGIPWEVSKDRPFASSTTYIGFN